MSKQIRFVVDQKVKPAMLDDLEKRIVYCSSRLKGFTFDLERNEAAFEITGEGGEEEITDKAKRFIEDMAKGYRPIKSKVIFENKHKNPQYRADMLKELKKRRWAWHLESGQMGLAGEALALVDRFDSLMRDIGIREFGAEPERYPTLIPADTLHSCGHFTSFPQSVTFASHIHEDYDLINGFIEANKGQDQIMIPEGALEKPSFCLSPAVCYHSYSSRRDVTLDKPTVVTAVGKCFRYESDNMKGLERLWDFTMREIIFIGGNEWVVKQREKSIELIKVLLGELGLACTIESANDPFFAQDFATKAYYQLRSDLKFEIRFNINPEQSIAVGSFNLHDDFFGKAFQIRLDTHNVFTGCTAFGLERWVYAFICQHGFNPSNWPAIARG